MRSWALASAAFTMVWSFAAQAQESIANGRAIARGICATCHGTRTGEIDSPNPYAPSFENIANTPGMTAAALRVALTTSHRTMPNIILDPAQQRDIVAYVLTLKDRD